MLKQLGSGAPARSCPRNGSSSSCGHLHSGLWTGSRINLPCPLPGCDVDRGIRKPRPARHRHLSPSRPRALPELRHTQLRCPWPQRSSPCRSAELRAGRAATPSRAALLLPPSHLPTPNLHRAAASAPAAMGAAHATAGSGTRPDRSRARRRGQHPACRATSR